MIKRLRKIGRERGIVLEKALLDGLGIGEGDLVEVVAGESGLVLRKADRKARESAPGQTRFPRPERNLSVDDHGASAQGTQAGASRWREAPSSDRDEDRTSDRDQPGASYRVRTPPEPLRRERTSTSGRARTLKSEQLELAIDGGSVDGQSRTAARAAQRASKTRRAEGERAIGPATKARGASGRSVRSAEEPSLMGLHRIQRGHGGDRQTPQDASAEEMFARFGPSISSKVRAWVDGGSRGNPGPAGYGVHLEDGEGHLLDERSGYLGVATNNVAEYQGLLAALRAALDLGARELEVLADSELMVMQMNGRYQVRNEALKTLFAEAKALASRFPRFGIKHVPRTRNRDADRLANEAMDRGE